MSRPAVVRRRVVIWALLAGLTWLSTPAWTQTTPTLRVYIARHGESESNVAGTTTGFTDSPLTARGRDQARELADTLRGIRLDAVYASTLSRSLDTARMVAGGEVPTALDGLRERDWGRFTGMPSRDAEFLRRRDVSGDDLDGGESKEAFYERVRAAVEGIRQRHASGAILIVGHGASNAQILRALLDLTEEQARTINQANDEVYAVDIVGASRPFLWKLVRERNLGDL